MAMKLIMVPIALSLGYLAFEHRGEMIDLYRAAYPADPVKRAVLDGCADKIPNFNRLDSIDRQTCYSGYIGRAPVALAASPSPRYELNPSHLPGNDVRRQEANDGFHLMSPAVAAPAAPKPAAAQPQTPVVPARVTAPAGQKPPATAHHTIAHQPAAAKQGPATEPQR
jgi:hypothetical protein